METLIPGVIELNILEDNQFEVKYVFGGREIFDGGIVRIVIKGYAFTVAYIEQGEYS